MSIALTKFPDGRIATASLVSSVILAAFLTYREMLGYFFTATDSPTLIDTGRIRSLRDVGRIFSEPLMNGTELIELSLFYRPLATLSYSIDYFMWGLNPFGYHLTDLILHVSVSVLFFLLLRLLTSGNQVAAWLGAIIFTTHPILVESVPAVARRHDVMAALFLLASLFLFLKYRVAVRKSFLFLSIFFYIAALVSKEIAIILPALILGYSLILSSETKRFNVQVLRSLKATVPYVAATILVLFVRATIVHGMGGYDAALTPATSVASFFVNTSLNYFIAFLYPAPFLRSFFTPFPSTFDQIVSLLSLTALLFYSRALYRLASRNGGGITRGLKSALLIVFLLSLAFILAYPLIAPQINHWVQQGYYDQGPKFLTATMTRRNVAPVEEYFSRAAHLLHWLFSNLFFGSACVFLALIAIENRDKMKRFLVETHDGKIIIFFLLWTCLPLGIYLFTFTFTHRYMYISVIPLSGILAILLWESAQTAIRTVRAHNLRGLFSTQGLAEPAHHLLILVTVLAVSFVIYSPLLRKYGEWEDSGKISAKFLHRLTQIVPQLPNDAVIYIFNLPHRISSYETQVPRVKTVSYLDGYSIKSWINLEHPANRMKIVICSRWTPVSYPHSLQLEINKGPKNDVTLTVGSAGNAVLSTRPTTAACAGLMAQRIADPASAVN